MRLGLKLIKGYVNRGQYSLNDVKRTLK